MSMEGKKYLDRFNVSECELGLAEHIAKVVGASARGDIIFDGQPRAR